MYEYGDKLYEYINDLELKEFHTLVLHLIENIKMKILINDVKMKYQYPNTPYTNIRTLGLTYTWNIEDYIQFNEKERNRPQECFKINL